MILLRPVEERDLDAIAEFGGTPGFINLPEDPDLVHDRIVRSIRSFDTKHAVFSDNKFVFVAEDIGTKKIIGTSMVASQHGTLQSPHFSFQVASERTFSESINTGFIHGTLVLHTETDGPSEFGGLFVDPQHRNTEYKVGRQLAFVTFLFMGCNTDRFKTEVLAELMPPLNKKGQSPLWEAIGRRFTNMDYWEADALCQQNKEFIFSLFPSGKIYTTFFSAEARNAIGKVGHDTQSVLHMLKKIGFTYRSEVDPFDGGPHLRAEVKAITCIQAMRTAEVRWVDAEPAGALSGLISASYSSAFMVKAALQDGRLLCHSPLVQERLGHGKTVTFMPFYGSLE